MDPFFISLLIASYFLVLLAISWVTGRRADNASFFLGTRRSPWYIVSIGMIGSSISGVTFISVPGWVGAQRFTYMQMVAGFVLGYVVVANVLLPLYYRLNLTSIYSYLDKRFGLYSYKSGSLLFILSKTVGAAARLYLMASVLHMAVFASIGASFTLTVIVTISLIWLYTFRGGIRTIIWTDTLQTVLMLAAVILTIVFISRELNFGFGELVSTIAESPYSRIFVWDDWASSSHFIKQFFSGAFITIVMTGLDQDMMQKNLTCKNFKDARKNMLWYGAAFLPINLLFLSLGAMLFIFVAQMGIQMPERADELFPTLALGGYLPTIIGVLFILGLIAAAYSSADSALASLTTAFSVDILGVERMATDQAKRTRIIVHICFTILMALVVLVFRLVGEDSIINLVFILAGYTYGPLLGLFAAGLFTKWNIRDRLVPLLVVIPPVVTGVLDINSMNWFGFNLGYEKLMLNGLLTFLLLWAIRVKKVKEA